MSGVASADLEELLRWEGSGGTWRVVGEAGRGLELELLSCGRDEVMGQLCSAEPDLVAYVGEETSEPL